MTDRQQQLKPFEQLQDAAVRLLPFEEVVRRGDEARLIVEQAYALGMSEGRASEQRIQALREHGLQSQDATHRVCDTCGVQSMGVIGRPCPNVGCVGTILLRSPDEVAEIVRGIEGTIQNSELRRVREELAAYKPVIEEVRKCYDLGVDMPPSVEVAFARARQATNLRRIR